MAGLEDNIIGGFHSLIEKQRKETGEACISTVLFDNYSEVVHDRLPLDKIPEMARDVNSVRGSRSIQTSWKKVKMSHPGRPNKLPIVYTTII